jgi:environmental stress-induced protein Ves
MRVLHAADYRRMIWKNGGGETAEIAVFPEGAGLDDFGWRVSMATVASDGPFSAFAGVDRTLSVLEGDGIALEVEGHEGVRLTTGSPPYAFAADAATSARLIGGQIVDLNVMTRRARYWHRVLCHEVGGPERLSTGADQAILFCAGEGLRMGGEGLEADLGRYDALMLEGAQEISVDGRARVFLIELYPAGQLAVPA